MTQRIWLMKTEPDVFSFDQLLERGSEFWDGVRNYQARNFMRNDMQVGDIVLFYHSNANPSGIAGLALVMEAAKPDLSAQNPKSQYFDPQATPENPRWYGVTVGEPQKIRRFVSLSELKAEPTLKNMALLRKGQRLSILPVSTEEYAHILELTRR